MAKLYNLIVQSAEHALKLQAKNGAMPAGHNGLYHDLETPVRNTSHWLITFLKAYEITKDEKFLAAAQQAQDYVCSRDARPMKATFWHRFKPEKDFCNGLMGQAWTIEALAISGNYFEKEKVNTLAAEVFLLHPFNEKTGLWRRVNVDGSYIPFDLAFNHQLWFAAAGALIMNYDPAIKKQVFRFMELLPETLNIYLSGLVFHALKSTRTEVLGRVAKIKVTLNEQLQLLKYKRPDLHHKAIGYHGFNLYAFAMLKQQIPDHHFWQTPKFRKVLDYINDPTFKQELEGNKYGYPYNPAGIEVAYALEVFFPEKSAEAESWLALQLQQHFDFEKNMMDLHTDDAVTLAARFYEATRLSNLNVG